VLLWLHGKTNLGPEEKRRGRVAAGNPIAVGEPRFVVVDTSSLATAGGGAPAGTMYSAAAALLGGVVAGDADETPSFSVFALTFPKIASNSVKEEPWRSILNKTS
jgi:hypothetical protein